MFRLGKLRWTKKINKKSLTIQLVGRFHQKLLKLKIKDWDRANFWGIV